MNRERNLFGFGGGFMNLCDQLFDLLVLSLLWILCSLPLVTVGASTSALYYAVVKCVKRRGGYAAGSFFHSFRQNLAPGTRLWIIFAAATFAMHLNIGILLEISEGGAGQFFAGFYVFVSVYLLIMACYAFPALSRFDMGAGWIFKLALYMTVRYLPTSLALLAVLASAFVLTMRVPALLLLAPGPTVFLMSEFLERVLANHGPKEEMTTETEGGYR